MRRGIAILGAGVLGLAGLVAYGENRLPAPALPEIQINGNRQPAGQVREGVLYVRLEVMGSWHPEGLEAPGVEVVTPSAYGIAIRPRNPHVPLNLLLGKLRCHANTDRLSTVLNLSVSCISGWLPGFESQANDR